MTESLDHRGWRADIAAYLLGALEPEETAAVETHLEGCERCREELRWLRPAVDQLPESVDQLAPPPELRDRLLAEVGASSGDAAERAGAPRRRRSDRGLGRFILRPAMALGAVALVAAAIVGYSLGGGEEGTQTSTVAAKGLGDLRATLERNGDKGTLTMAGLRQAPSSHVYQAWVQRGDEIEPASLFDANRDRTARVSLPRSLEGADAVMVTIEPRGGSRQPSATPVVDVPLSE